MRSGYHAIQGNRVKKGEVKTATQHKLDYKYKSKRKPCPGMPEDFRDLQRLLNDLAARAKRWFLQVWRQMPRTTALSTIHGCGPT